MGAFVWVILSGSLLFFVLMVHAALTQTLRYHKLMRDYAEEDARMRAYVQERIRLLG
jgi:hypothetical protein